MIYVIYMIWYGLIWYDINSDEMQLVLSCRAQKSIFRPGCYSPPFPTTPHQSITRDRWQLAAHCGSSQKKSSSCMHAVTLCRPPRCISQYIRKTCIYIWSVVYMKRTYLYKTCKMYVYIAWICARYPVIIRLFYWENKSTQNLQPASSDVIAESRSRSTVKHDFPLKR